MTRGQSKSARENVLGARRPMESQLRALLSSGDLRALDALLSCYGESLMAYLQHLLTDASQCEDVIHDALLKIFEDASSGRAIRDLTPWVFKVARNQALDRVRRQQRRERIMQRAAAEKPVTIIAPQHSLEELEFNAAVAAALARLPEVYRSAFLLREIEGLAYEDIAAVMNCSTKTVSSRLSRARRELRDRLAAWTEGLA